MESTAEKRRNLTPTLGDGNYRDGLLRRDAIDDHISANGPEQHWIIRQIIACVSHARHAPEGVERIEELADPTIGGVNVIGGDVFPNFVKIEICIALRT